MTKTCPSCYSCGMPLENPSDYSLGDTNSTFCSYCTDAQGNLKPYEKIVEGMADYLVHSQGLDKEVAVEMAKEVLSQQPAWKDRN